MLETISKTINPKLSTVMTIRSLCTVWATIAVMKNNPTPAYAHSLIEIGIAGTRRMTTAISFKIANCILKKSGNPKALTPSIGDLLNK